MPIKTLKNKPLVEAILEIRWNLQTTPAGIIGDDLYDIMLGQFRQSLIDILPHHTRLPFSMIPGLTFPYQVQHQFRASADGWPLVQLGPGVLTVNETEGYTSENFLPLCERVYSTISDFWRENNKEPSISHVALRYIDADILNENVVCFLKKLGVNISFEERLLNPDVFGEVLPSQIQLNTTFKLKNPVGLFSFSFNIGKKKDEDALIWESQVISTADECRAFIDNPSEWLQKSHDITHDVFFAMIQGELKDKYK